MYVKTIYILLLYSSLAFPQFAYTGEIGAISNYITKIKSNNPLEKTDSIYLFAKEITGSENQALKALIFSTVPYNIIPVTLPLIGSFNLRIPSAIDTIYNLKNDSLPNRFFFDSPNYTFGDRDKLAHFFGSAFLSNSSWFLGLGRFIGYFVEIFEKNLEAQNSIDERDLMVNYLGLSFGNIIKNNPDVLPSEVLIHYDLFYNRICL